MIDPDNIILARKNDKTNIVLDDIPPCDVLVWDLDNPKELKQYLSTIEKQIRRSFEYRNMIHFLKTYYDMDQCAFIKYDATDLANIRIEIHHSPFTLYDIVCIVYRKKIFYQELLTTSMVAKECTMLHYKLLVGLIPLSKTVHELVHAGKLFIPSTSVYGDYNAFIDTYKDFCDEDQLETINRIEKYSTEYSELVNTSILDQNPITLQVNNSNFILPNLSNLESNMNNRITEIKQNGYRLPTLEDKKENFSDTVLERSSISPTVIKDNNEIIDPLFFT